MCKNGAKQGQKRLFLEESGKRLEGVFCVQDPDLEGFVVVGWEGLEPSTNALKGRCSTIELPTRSGPGSERTQTETNT